MFKHTPIFRLVAAALLAGAGLGIAGCAVEPIWVLHDGLKETWYTRYTIRGVQDGFKKVTYKSNYLSHLVAFQPGVKVTAIRYSDVRVDMEIDGIPCSMLYRDAPFPTEPAKINEFLAKYFVKNPGELRLSSQPKDIQDYIKAGDAAKEMTKEQVFLALGYPSHIDNYTLADHLPRERILQSNQWIYRYNEIMFIPTYWVYQFNDEGKLKIVIR